VSGCSGGAINGADLCQWEVGREAEWAASNRERWHRLRTKDVHRRWFPLGQLSWWHTGLRRLVVERYLRKHIDPARVRDSGRRLIIGAVTRATAEEVTWTEVDSDVLIDAVVASCAIPFAFEPQVVDGVEYVDWGVQTVAPVSVLVDAGCTEIDAIIPFPAELPPFPAPRNALDAGLAAVDMQNHQILTDDLRVPDGVKLNEHRPDRDLGDGLDFSRKTNAWRYQLGETIGRQEQTR
jgi:predicted acylesterase/phospholipase RssA